MKKSKKSIAVVFAMILGCLPKNSLAAPKNNSLANEDNSLASGKPESVGGAEQRSKKMSNSTKISLGLSAGEVGLETFGWFLPKLWTPGKGVAEAVEWIFSSNELKPKKEVEKKVKKTKKELREAIEVFVSEDAPISTDNEVKAFKEVMGNVYTQYANSNEKLFNDFHKDNIREYNGFRVVKSAEGHYKDGGNKKKSDYCVYILTKGDDYQKLLEYLNQSEFNEFKDLCKYAEESGEKIVVGCGIYDYVSPSGNSRILKSFFCLGLESDLADDNIINFSDTKYRFFEYILRNKKANVDKLEERIENKSNSKTYIVK